MIDKVIDEILDTEKSADEFLRLANEQSEQVMLSTHAEAEENKRKFYASVKDKIKVITANAEAEGERAAAKILADAAATAEKLKQKANKNMDRTVDKLAERMTKSKF